MDELLTDDERNESAATYGKNMLDTIFPGAETELVFADGEFMKKIYAAHILYAHWEKVSVGKAQIKKLTAKKNGKLKITVTPVKSADGYQICYAPKKKFLKKGTKKAHIKKTAVTVKKLKKGKTYYVKARAYKLDSTGRRVYGRYGAVKKKK